MIIEYLSIFNVENLQSIYFIPISLSLFSPLARSISAVVFPVDLVEDEDEDVDEVLFLGNPRSS